MRGDIMTYEQWKITDDINELKAKLDKSDYVTSKLTEVIAIAMVQGDNTRLVEVYNEYKELIDQRQAWRDEINRLEAQLAELKQ
jgi:uncharacterized protein YlxP (DUF503 family)